MQACDTAFQAVWSHPRRVAGLWIEQGIEQGREEGLDACRRMILRLGRRRFGKPSAARQERLDQMTDLSRLEAMSDLIGEAAGRDDLLNR